MKTYRLQVTIQSDGYSRVDGYSDMPCFIVDKIKQDAKLLANQLKNQQQ